LRTKHTSQRSQIFDFIEHHYKPFLKRFLSVCQISSTLEVIFDDLSSVSAHLYRMKLKKRKGYTLLHDALSDRNLINGQGSIIELASNREFDTISLRSYSSSDSRRVRFVESIVTEIWEDQNPINEKGQSSHRFSKCQANRARKLKHLVKSCQLNNYEVSMYY